MGVNPIVSGITAGLNILSNLLDRSHRSSGVSNVTSNLRQLEQMAQDLGISTQKLQKAIGSAVAAANGDPAQTLSLVAGKLGVSTSTLQTAMGKVGFSFFNAYA